MSEAKKRASKDKYLATVLDDVLDAFACENVPKEGYIIVKPYIVAGYPRRLPRKRHLKLVGRRRA